MFGYIEVCDSFHDGFRVLLTLRLLCICSALSLLSDRDKEDALDAQVLHKGKQQTTTFQEGGESS